MTPPKIPNPRLLRDSKQDQDDKVEILGHNRVLQLVTATSRLHVPGQPND